MHESENNLQLLLKYPLISTKTDEGCKHYVGKIMCGNRDVNVHVIETNNNNKINFTLKTGLKPEIDAQLTCISAISIVEYLDKVSALLETDNIEYKNLVNVYRKVIHEYSEFTQFHLSVKKSHISVELSEISIMTVDEGGREHCLKISIDFNETKNIFRPQIVNLPQKMADDFNNNFHSLSEIYSKFLGIIEILQPFFDVMDDIDTCCCILDPEQPTRKDCFRRIWLEQNLSVMVIIDPLNVKARPELKFLGPQQTVDLYHQKLSDRLEDWDESAPLHQGLLNILGLEAFPVKPKQDHQVLIDVGECSICFSSRLNDQLPEIICDNKSCQTFFHTSCLYEWLMSVNSKRIFTHLYGQCPNCEKAISCPTPDVT